MIRRSSLPVRHTGSGSPRIVAKARPRRRSAVVIRDACQQVPRVVRTGRSLV
jgi:hypothetical protein